MYTEVKDLGEEVFRDQVRRKVQIWASPVGEERFGLSPTICFCNERKVGNDVVMEVLVPGVSPRVIESLVVHAPLFGAAFERALGLTRSLRIQFSN